MSNINYSKNSLVFLDLLGFKSLVNQNQSLEVILEVLNKLTFATDVSLYENYLKIQRMQFSDGILIWANTISYKDIVIFLSKIGFAISRLHAQGIFTRGCIAYGDHFTDNNILVSPVFIEAYTAEQENAIFPRLIMSSTFVNHVESIIELSSNKEKLRSDFKMLTCLDNDGFRFLNYFPFGYVEVQKNEPDESKVNQARWFLSHKNVITNHLNKYSDFKIKSKYIWLANYHNNSIKNEILDEHVEKFIIDSKLLYLY